MVPAPPVVINGPSVLRASYDYRGHERAAGWIVGIVGAATGIVMIAASAHEHEICDADGFCHTRETASAPLLAGGVLVLLASGIVGGVLATQPDHARISVEPLRLHGYGTWRESLAALDAKARPEGASLELSF